MAGIFNVPAPSMGGIVRATGGRVGSATGASAINARAREKTAAAQAMEAAKAQTAAVTTNTATATPSVRPLVGPSPVRQSAYETQAQTKLASDLDLNRMKVANTHDQTMQGAGFAAEQAQQERDLAAQQAAMAAEQQFAGIESAADRGHDLTLLDKRAALNNADFTQRMGAVQGLAGGSGEPGAGPVTPTVDPAAANAARDAVFARAKDRAGQVARGSLDALRNVVGERGLVGGGYEEKGIADVVGGAQGELGEVIRMQAEDELAGLTRTQDQQFAAGQSKLGRDAAWKQSVLGLLGGGGVY